MVCNSSVTLDNIKQQRNAVIVERGLSGKRVRNRPAIIAIEPPGINEEEYAKTDWAVPREGFSDATWKVLSGNILVGSGLHFSREDLDMFRSVCPRYDFGPGPSRTTP